MSSEVKKLVIFTLKKLISETENSFSFYAHPRAVMRMRVVLFCVDLHIKKL